MCDSERACPASCRDTGTGDTCGPARCVVLTRRRALLQGAWTPGEGTHSEEQVNLCSVHQAPGTGPAAREDEKVCSKTQSSVGPNPTAKGPPGTCGAKVGENVTSQSTRLLASPLLWGDRRRADVPWCSGSFPAGSPGWARPERVGFVQETPGRKGSRGQRLRARGLGRSTPFEPLRVAVAVQGPGFPGMGPNDPGGVRGAARGSEPCFCHLDTVRLFTGDPCAGVRRPRSQSRPWGHLCETLSRWPPLWAPVPLG